MQSLNALAKESFNRAVSKGFYENPPTVLERIALIHSEISEAHEEGSKGLIRTYYNGNKPEGFGIELADVVIRIADHCGCFNIDLDLAMKRSSWRRGGVLMSEHGVVVEGLDRCMCLLHGTVSDAAERFREGKLEMQGNGVLWEGFPIEYARAIHQVYRLTDACHLDLDELIRIKSDYNETRPHKHGKAC